MNNNLDPKEIKQRLDGELEDIKMNEKLEWRILGQYKGTGFAKIGNRRKKRFIAKKTLAGIGVVAASFILFIVGCFAYLQYDTFKAYLQTGNNIIIKQIDNNKVALGFLPTLDSESKLISLLERNNSYKLYADSGRQGIMRYGAAQESAPNLQEGSFKDTSKDSNGDYSKTNVQVEGVDEGDIVKTDGKYIYRLSFGQNNTQWFNIMEDREIAPDSGSYTTPNQLMNTNKLTIIEAQSDGKLKFISEIKLDRNQDASEFYLDSTTISIICNSNTMISDQYKQTTQVLVYGIKDITKPQLLKKYQIEGSYLSSRKIDNYIYLVSNKSIQYDYNYGNSTNKLLSPPAICDNKSNNSFTNIKYSDVSYFPEQNYQTYISISSIDTSKPEKDAKVTTFLSSGQNIYASLNNLYTVNSRFNYSPYDRYGSFDVSKFNLENGNVVYKARAEKIPGRILNQYSMDEYKGNFRIAVTAEANELYVFDSNMKETGKITHMAKGEQIKSVRFMGDKGYVVTFRQTDPLFVIDLSKPTAPKILGQLKIPGFSEYLHPYDETHIIGVGKSASDSGRVNGIKMSMFDVSDPLNPKEMFTRDIGEGLENPNNSIGQNPKAFFFDKEKSIIALPIDSYIYNNINRANTKTDYFHVYSVDMKSGFVLKAKLIAQEKLNGYYYGSEDSRALYIKDKFFTTTDNIIKSFEYNTFKQIDSLSLDNK